MCGSMGHRYDMYHWEIASMAFDQTTGNANLDEQTRVLKQNREAIEKRLVKLKG
ncbi:hypothetical protein ES703_78378 [subsurface metagenome]